MCCLVLALGSKSQLPPPEKNGRERKGGKEGGREIQAYRGYLQDRDRQDLDKGQHVPIATPEVAAVVGTPFLR